MVTVLSFCMICIKLCLLFYISRLREYSNFMSTLEGTAFLCSVCNNELSVIIFNWQPQKPDGKRKVEESNRDELIAKRQRAGNAGNTEISDHDRLTQMMNDIPEVVTYCFVIIHLFIMFIPLFVACCP